MNRLCPICKDGAVHCYVDSGDRSEWRVYGDSYRLVQCDECETVHTNPLPEQAPLERLYKNDYNYRWFQDHLDAKTRDAGIRFDEYSRNLGKRVLDFGGGLGYFSSVARSHGKESMTYDPYVRNDTVASTLWDSVVALHVLEHSNDPEQLLISINELLKPGGTMILAVPNFLSDGYKTLGMSWVWAQPPLVHIFHFTEKGLKKLVKACGFDVVDVSYHERWDANLESDLRQYERFRRLDRGWGRCPVRYIRSYQKYIAARNSRFRFEVLKSALDRYDRSYAGYAELQIVAKKKG